MKKILVLANNDVGLYKFRKELIQELLKDNDVYISLPNGKLVEPLIQMGCKFIDTPVDRRGINPITDFKLLNRYRKVIKDVKPELIITYTIKPNIYGSLIERMKHIDYAVNITGLGTMFQSDNLLKKMIIFMYKTALKKVKTVFFENVENKDIFIKNKITEEGRVCVLNGAGVNLEEYPFTKYPEEEKEIRFLFIGRIMKEKGIDEFLYAAKKIKEENIDIQFYIVGPMEDDYENIIKEYIDNDIINYYGYQEDVKPYIEGCHCFVLPSYHEGMANTLLEAASMGRALITSNIHGCKEAVEDGVNGFLCEKQNSDSLYKVMKKFIQLSFDEKVKMSICGRKRMKKLFDKRKMVECTIKALVK